LGVDLSPRIADSLVRDEEYPAKVDRGQQRETFFGDLEQETRTYQKDPDRVADIRRVRVIAMLDLGYNIDLISYAAFTRLLEALDDKRLAGRVRELAGS
jgi:hypothetical protein